jgi:hypothetical protein
MAPVVPEPTTSIELVQPDETPARHDRYTARRLPYRCETGLDNNRAIALNIPRRAGLDNRRDRNPKHHQRLQECEEHCVVQYCLLPLEHRFQTRLGQGVCLLPTQADMDVRNGRFRSRQHHLCVGSVEYSRYCWPAGLWAWGRRRDGWELRYYGTFCSASTPAYDDGCY